MRTPLLTAGLVVTAFAAVHPADASPAPSTLLRDVQAGIGEAGEPDTFTPSPSDITAEPSIAANPDNPANAVVAFKIGFGEAIGVATTVDGGRTWRSTVLPCTNRPTAAAEGCDKKATLASTDPVVAFGHGDVVRVAFIDHPQDFIDVSTSRDGGLTWGLPELAEGPTSSLFTHDKEWIAVDTGTGAGHHPGRLYLVWAQEPMGSPQATYSDDGEQWATPVDFPIGHGSDFQAMVLADGALGVFYDTGDTSAVVLPPTAPSAPEHYMFVRATVPIPGSPLVLGTPVVVSPAVHTNEPDQATVLDAATAAVDPGTGDIYAAWSDSTGRTTFNNIVMTSSSDGGNTWRPPSPVFSDPDGDAFHPALSIGRDGRLHVAWRHRPAEGGALGAALQTFATESVDGGRTFAPATQLTGATTDVTFAQRVLYPVYDNWFVGDYQQSTTSGPLTYIARAEAYDIGSGGQFCPQAAGADQSAKCVPAPHERIWVAVLGPH